MARAQVAVAAIAALLLTQSPTLGVLGQEKDALDSLALLLPPFVTAHFDDIVKAAAATCEALPLELIFSRQFLTETELQEVIEFTPGARRAYRASHAHIRIQDIFPRPPTSLVIYVPGWFNTPEDESTQTIVSALLQKTPIVLVLDTRRSFTKGYITAASRIKPLAEVLYKLIKRLKNQGLPTEFIHLVGFSLGAHVAGITGKLVQRGMNIKLGKITALDPAKPCFSRYSDFRLDRGDAKFVQVIHTSVGVLGLGQPVGHVDVYANGVNSKQPECSNRRISIECDHSQSWKLYASSVRRTMLGRRCKGWDELTSGKCSGNMTVVGFGCNPNTRGLFFYKSEARIRRGEPRLHVYNPFDIFTWFAR